MLLELVLVNDFYSSELIGEKMLGADHLTKSATAYNRINLIEIFYIVSALDSHDILHSN